MDYTGWWFLTKVVKAKGRMGDHNSFNKENISKQLYKLKLAHVNKDIL